VKILEEIALFLLAYALRGSDEMKIIDFEWPWKL